MYPEFNIGDCVYSLHPCGHNLVEIRWGMIVGINCRVNPQATVSSAGDLVTDIIEIIYRIHPIEKSDQYRFYLHPDKSEQYESSSLTFETRCDAKVYIESLASNLSYGE